MTADIHRETGSPIMPGGGAMSMVNSSGCLRKPGVGYPITLASGSGAQNAAGCGFPDLCLPLPGCPGPSLAQTKDIIPGVRGLCGIGTWAVGSVFMTIPIGIIC